jgi:nuclear pore complex protein Nup155
MQLCISTFIFSQYYSQEISSFVDQPDVISHVAVVKAKPGVFIDEISHILVVCTPISVLLIGLSLSSVSGPNNRVHKEIRLYATDMSAPTEVEMTSIIGTQHGRIFMCGSQDGNLYELHYQESESWFGKRVQLINHSVGGVQSLFPRFASIRSEGLRFLLARSMSFTIHPQIESHWSFPMFHGTASTP